MSDISNNFCVTLTHDQIPEFEKRTGLKWKFNAKHCDFCNKRLSKDHKSKKCVLCPAIFDQCDECTSKDNKVVCHKPHDVEQSYEERSDQEINKVIQKMTEVKIDDAKCVKWLVSMYDFNEQHIDVSDLFKKCKGNELEALDWFGKVATDGFPIIASHKDGVFSLTIYKKIIFSNGED